MTQNHLVAHQSMICTLNADLILKLNRKIPVFSFLKVAFGNWSKLYPGLKLDTVTRKEKWRVKKLLLRIISNNLTQLDKAILYAYTPAAAISGMMVAMFGEDMATIGIYTIISGLLYFGLLCRLMAASQISGSDWDSSLKVALMELTKNNARVSANLLELKTMMDKNWIDEGILLTLGPADTIGMMRLTQTLASARSVSEVELDGDTEELVDRVVEAVRQMNDTKFEGKVRVSAMQGLT